MTEERTLVANIVPELDDATLDSFIEELKSELTFTTEIVANVTTPSTGASDATATDLTSVTDAMKETTQAVKDSMDAVEGAMDGMSDTLTMVSDSLMDVGDSLEGIPDVVSESMSSAFDTLSGEIGDTLSDSLTAVSDSLEDMPDIISDGMSDAWESLSGELDDAMGSITETMSDAVEGAMDAVSDTTDSIADATASMGDGLGDLADVVSDGNSESKSIGSSIMSAVGTVAEVGVGLLRSMFDILEGLWKRLVDSSPLLRETMNLINNAFSLILMPVGTAIAVELIPLVVELYDFIGTLTQTMWNAYEEGGLGAMIAVGISEGIPALLEFFQEALMLIPDDIPVISDIRDFAVWVLDWMVENADVLVGIFETLLSVIQWVGENIGTVITLMGTFIGWYIGYTVAKDAMGVGALIPGVGALAGLAVGGSIGALAGTALGGGVAYAVGAFAEGGYVSSPQFAMVGEDEPEYIIPESRMPSFLASNTVNSGATYNLNFYGYNEDQLVSKVEEITARNTMLSSLRGGI